MKQLSTLSLGILLSCYSFAQSDPFSSKPSNTNTDTNTFTPRSAATNVPQDTVPPEDTTTTNLEPDKFSKEYLYSTFPEKKLPLTLDIKSEEEAKKLIKNNNLESLGILSMQKFFPIHSVLDKTDKDMDERADYYYPLGYIKISEHIELFLCLEEWNAYDDNKHFWHIKGYTFKDREQFISEFTFSSCYTNDNEPHILNKKVGAWGKPVEQEKLLISKNEKHIFHTKATINADFTITCTQIDVRTLEQDEAPITYTATQESDARLNDKGEFSHKIQKTFAGIQVNQYNDQFLPEEVYREGKILWGDHYKDAFGEHYAIITYTTLDGSTDKTSDTEMQLHFYHYIKPNGANKFEMIHQSVEQTKNCTLGVQHFLNAPRPIILTDLDKNNVLEASILYWLDCRNTTSASVQMFLALWNAKQELRLPASVDLKLGTQTSTFNQQWGKVPEPIRTYIGKLMTKCAAKTKKN